MYYCAYCGEDNSDDPEIAIVKYKKVLENNKDSKPKVNLWESGFYYKPDSIPNNEWNKVINAQSDEYFKWKYEILVHNFICFCSIDCMIKYFTDDN